MIRTVGRSTLACRLLIGLCLCRSAPAHADDELIAHWPLAGDSRDASGHALHATPHNVAFSPGDREREDRPAAVFDGRDAWLECPIDDQFSFGLKDFSVSVWVHTDEALDDVPGDVFSRFDSDLQRGFHLAIKTNAGVTFTQANWRQLQFGMDDDRPQATWEDCGRPGNAVLAFALCSFQGELYAGTCEPGQDETGHVYRYLGEGQWHDCGAPDESNAVITLAAYNGELYAGTGKYRLAGSALPESENSVLGGHIYRYAGDGRWIDCSGLPDVEAVGGLAVFKGQLYATSLYRPAAFYRYEGQQQWTGCSAPKRPEAARGETSHMRVEAMGAYNGWLYATSYDGGHVFRYDGNEWEDCGRLGENTQTYSFAVYQERLYVGTWPSGRVYRFEEPHRWTDVGRLGEELEVMGMLVHNGRLIAGTLPSAEVYEFDGESTWSKLTRLDHTPDVRYRRAWTMAEHDGRVFCSTLPSGHVYSWRTGRVAMADVSLPAGWHHVAAVRSRDSLRIYVDGGLVGDEAIDDAEGDDLSLDRPLEIGRGPNGHFNGRLSDVRLFGKALSPADIQRLLKE